MIVVIEAVLGVIRYVQVGPAVVVVVPHGHAESPALVGHACFVRNVSKSAVVIVVKESGTGRLSFSMQRTESRTIDQINVRPAIVVVIENGHTRTGSFED